MCAKNSLAPWLLVAYFATASLAQDRPLPAVEAAQHFTLPKGFKATLFAGEPELVQPIAFAFDDRGRIWVVENYSYPGWAGEKHDRVSIFSDNDGDGHFDERKVFLDTGSNLSGIEWGFGGVWLCSTPNLIFVPDANGDDVPDGPPIVKLDGWDLKAKHNVFNSLTWGPDGWLYGCNGILSNSNVGKPGAQGEKRIALNCGVWRYHPTREVFEVVASGTTNPWGLDFDQFGQCFITNCVIQHLWHIVPGAHFQRMFGEDTDSYTYQLMNSCADHIHWAGGPWQEGLGGKHNDYGGGHAHVGAMLYLGDNWPDEYRNHLFTCNIHGNRVNQDVLERRASGYVAHHGTDFLLANDPWFRGMSVKYGADGAVFVSDWSDTGECHNYETVDRSNGRIYKITYGTTKPWKSDLSQLSDNELAELQTHKNDWVVRHSRRLLQERSTKGHLSDEVHKQLLAMLRNNPDSKLALRALWTLHAINATTDQLLIETMDSESDVLRGWAVQLSLEGKQPSPAIISRLTRLAQSDVSSWVRLSLAAGMQRIRLKDRWPIADNLVRHSEDAPDVNLSLMIWYGIEPLAVPSSDGALNLIKSSRIPLVRKYLVRRIATSATVDDLASLIHLMSDPSDDLRDIVLTGMIEAFEGRRKVAMPEGWSALYSLLTESSSPAVREKARLLGLIFGDSKALSELRSLAADNHEPAESRSRAVVALTQSNAADLASLLQELLADPSVRIAALRGLAACNDDTIPSLILSKYRDLDLTTRREAISTLAVRKRWALALMEAIDKEDVPRGDVTAFHIQQLQSLGDAHVSERVQKVWGNVRPTTADRIAMIARYKQHLSKDALASAVLSKGRVVFTKTCGTCHTLFDSGGKIGPELTGAQRDNLDYVLSNVLDPSAVVPKQYQTTLITTADGRVLSGIIKSEDDHRISIQTATEALIVPKNEVESRDVTPNSMMPDGLLQSLSDDEVRDLVAYLASPSQVSISTGDSASSR
jgi:putative membrane-bound dehydrogenase-like protein